jgi:hypothetical protein
MSTDDQWQEAMDDRDALIAELATVLRSIDQPVSPDGIVTHYCPFCGGARWAEGTLNHAPSCAQQSVLAKVPAP